MIAEKHIMPPRKNAHLLPAAPLRSAPSDFSRRPPPIGRASRKPTAKKKVTSAVKVFRPVARQPRSMEAAREWC